MNEVGKSVLTGRVLVCDRYAIYRRVDTESSRRRHVKILTSLFFRYFSELLIYNSVMASKNKNKEAFTRTNACK